MARYLGIGWLCVLYCRIALIIASSTSPSGPLVNAGPQPQRVTVGMVIENAMAILRSSSAKDGNAPSLPAGGLAKQGEPTAEASSNRKGRQLFRLPPGAKINSLFNPLLLYPGWMTSYYSIWPAVVAISLGFIWPFYEYLRTGHTYYHPGFVFDKDFTEFTKWYFKHQIYKKKYWNLDAYLARYFEAHNDALKSFFELRDVPERQLIQYAEELGVRPKVLDEGKNQTAASSSNKNDEASVKLQPENSPGNGTKKVEDVLEEMVTQMLEDNAGLRAFLANTTTDGGHQKIKDAMRSIIQRQFDKNAANGDDPDLTKTGSQDDHQQSSVSEADVNNGEDLTAFENQQGVDKNGVTISVQSDSEPATVQTPAEDHQYDVDYFSQIFNDLYAKHYDNNDVDDSAKEGPGNKEADRKLMSRSGHPSIDERTLNTENAGLVVENKRLQRRSSNGDAKMKKLRRLARIRGNLRNRRKNGNKRKANHLRRNKKNRRQEGSLADEEHKKPGFLSILYHVLKHRFGFEK